LVELAMPAMRRDRREATLRSWLKVIPDELVRVRPVLNIGFVGALVSGGELEGMEDRLRDAERWLDTDTACSTGSETPSGEIVVRDLEELPRLPGTIEMYRAALALVAGDRPGTVMHAKRAIDLSPEEDQLPRAGAAGLMGLAFWGSGDLEAGHQAYAECMEGLRRAGHIADTFGCAIALADIRIAQGRIGDAQRTYAEALQRAAEHGGPVLRGTADMYVGMSELHRERDDLPRC
jgi:LuxR family maltose regulon positive regulatory protein